MLRAAQQGWVGGGGVGVGAGVSVGVGVSSGIATPIPIPIRTTRARGRWRRGGRHGRLRERRAEREEARAEGDRGQPAERGQGGAEERGLGARVRSVDGEGEGARCPGGRGEGEAGEVLRDVPVVAAVVAGFALRDVDPGDASAGRGLCGDAEDAGD